MKMESPDPYFHNIHPQIMFRLGFNVGLNWEKFKEKGFKKVCCGCMIEDTPSEKNTSFACASLFPHGFALVLDISEQPLKSKKIQKHKYKNI